MEIDEQKSTTFASMFYSNNYIHVHLFLVKEAHVSQNTGKAKNCDISFTLL